MYFLGVDIGTTSAKAVAFSETGEVLCSIAQGYDMQHPAPDRSEQDPDEIYEATIKAIAHVVQTVGSEPLCITFAAAMHSIIAVDEIGRPLTPCIIWADNRAAKLAEDLRNTQEGKQFYSTTGVPVHAMSPLCKLLWFKEADPQIFTAAHKFIGIKEYIFYRLFGSFIVDTSIASATGLLNIKTLEWAEEILTYVGIESHQLSELVPVKHCSYYQNTHPALRLSAVVPFIAGGSDGTLATLGSTNEAGALSLSIGTSGAVRRLVAVAETDSAMRTFCYHLKDAAYVIGGATNNGAVVLQWLKENLLQTDDDHEVLFADAATAPAGSDGLLMLPYLLGERAPLWNAQAKAVWFGAAIHHARAHFIRAAMEGVIYSLYSIAQVIAEQHPFTVVYASGGFVKSELWLQIAADIFGCPIEVAGDGESAAFGAAMVGAEATVLPANFQRTTTSKYEPIPGNHELYQKGFSRFQRLYQLLKEEMK